jgi:hypothetical protein
MSGPGNRLEDKTARIAELRCKLAQIQLLATNPQAIELHELGLVELDRDARPKAVDIVWLAESIAARMLRAFGPAGAATS